MKRIASIGVVLQVLFMTVQALGQAPAAAPTATADVDRIFARWTTASPGCAVGASVKGQPRVAAAYGMADLEHDVANTVDTIFEAGSVSKQFTAAAVLLLARDGKLSLDDPVHRYIPELPDYGTPITVGQLLTHTSGLRDWGAIAGIEGWPRGARQHTHAHMLEIAARQRALNFTPGSRWSYSNTGYNLAAVLVSRVSGVSFADFTRTRIFEPLGMARTSWRDDHKRIVKGRAIAYAAAGAGYRTEMPFENVHGNAALLTTVGDLLTWTRNFTSPRVGDAAFVARQQEVVGFPSGRRHTYAYGLNVSQYKGVREVSHSGDTAGYRAFLAWYPEQDAAVAVLCNAGNANPTEYAHTVADLLLGSALDASAVAPAAIAEAQGPTASLPRDESYRPTAADLAAYAGTYRNDEAETTLRVVVDGSTLIAIRRPDARIVLRPRAADVFDAGGGLGAVVFRRNASGAVHELSVVQDRVWDLRFARQASGTGSF